MPSEQDIFDANQQGDLALRVEELETKLQLLLNNGLDFMLIRPGVMRYGGGAVQLDDKGQHMRVYDGGNALASPPDASRVQWHRDDFNGVVVGDVVGGYATPSALLIHSLWARVFPSQVGSTSDMSIGVYDSDVEDWIARLQLNDGGVRPMVLTTLIDTGLFAVEKVDADNYRLMVRKSGALVEVAGSMKTANTGQYLIPSLGAGTVVRSASGAYGSWYPLPLGDAVAPAAPTETSNSANVLMPPTVAAGDLLVVLCARNGGAVGTGAGFTSLGSGANTVNLHVFYKVAAGTEGETTVSFSSCGVAQVYRILAANYSGIPTISTAATGTGTTADPTAVTSPAGRFLSLAVAGLVGDSTVNVTASPSGYSTIDNRQQGIGSDVFGTSIGSAYLIASGTSENPAQFTNGSNPWVAFVVAIAASNAVLEATYITDLSLEISGTPTYSQVQLGTGAVGAESAIGTYKLTASDWTVQCGAVIPVASGTRLSARMATNTSAADHLLTLGMLNQDDAV